MRKSAVSCKLSVVSCARTRAFTLIETLIAISILLVAVVGPISLIGDATHKLYYSKDQMIAINLAQEGIEAVRQVRDSNMLAVGAWDTNITAGNYMVNLKNDPPVVLLTDSNVYIDSGTGLYEQGTVTATTTQFTRTVTIADVVAGIEKNVTSTVTWRTGGDTGTVAFSENIFNWQI
ncbi:MAG: type II secretion system protein [Candidatus Paceibacterota bacterium]